VIGLRSQKRTLLSPKRLPISPEHPSSEANKTPHISRWPVDFINEKDTI
jgi:hypothetical protein